MSLNNRHCASPRTLKGRVYLKSSCHPSTGEGVWLAGIRLFPRGVSVGWVPILKVQDGFTALTPLAAISASAPMGFVQLLTGRQR